MVERCPDKTEVPGSIPGVPTKPKFSAGQVRQMKKRTRCAWVPEGNQMYEKYHDEEWGIPVWDDRKLFEFIVLESAQAGLSWAVVLKKREGYRKAFAEFDPKRVARFTERDVAALLSNPDIIRNRQKINAAIANAKTFLMIQKEFGSFSEYMWRFVNGKTIKHRIMEISGYPKFIPEAVELAKDLKKRGFRFFGPTIAYAHMQAVGMVNDHMVRCFCHRP